MALHQVRNLLLHSRWCTLAGARSLVHSRSAAIDVLMRCFGLTQLLQDMTMTPGELQGGPDVCEDLERRGSREAQATMMIRFCCCTSTCRC